MTLPLILALAAVTGSLLESATRWVIAYTRAAGATAAEQSNIFGTEA